MNNLSLSVKIVCLILALTISLSLAACSGSTDSSTPDEAVKTTSEYSAKLFDTSCVHTINITISDDDWNDLKANPTAKNKVQDRYHHRRRNCHRGVLSHQGQHQPDRCRRG